MVKKKQKLFMLPDEAIEDLAAVQQDCQDAGLAISQSDIVALAIKRLRERGEILHPALTRKEEKRGKKS